MKKFGSFAKSRAFDYTYEDKMYTISRLPLMTKYDEQTNVLDFKPESSNAMKKIMPKIDRRNLMLKQTEKKGTGKLKFLKEHS